MRQMLLHTEAFEHRCLYTQKHLPRVALTLYTQKLLDTYCFSENRRSFDTQKLLDTYCFSENHRSFDTEKPSHRESFTQKLLHKLFHRSFYAQELLRTDAFTQKLVHTEAFYALKLLHREAFTHRRFPTEKTIPQRSFTTRQKNRNFT